MLGLTPTASCCITNDFLDFHEFLSAHVRVSALLAQFFLHGRVHFNPKTPILTFLLLYILASLPLLPLLNDQNPNKGKLVGPK